jgi:hypothetical protein
VKREATNGRGRAFFHNRPFSKGAASAPGRERASRAAAVSLDDARFQRAREPMERLVDRARRAVRGYARHGDLGIEFIGEATRKVDRMVAERQRAGPLRPAG